MPVSIGAEIGDLRNPEQQGREIGCAPTAQVSLFRQCIPLRPRGAAATMAGMLKRFHHLLVRLALPALACSSAAAQAPASRAEQPAELMAALSDARARGCAGRPGTDLPLRWAAPLSAAAQRMAGGTPPREAVRSAGYRATRLFQVSLSGYRSTAAMAQTVIAKYCERLTDPTLTDLGFHRQGAAAWIVLAAPFAPPPRAAAASVAARVLALTNEARSQPRVCGTRRFEAGAPLKPSPLLDRAAAMHAEDMARHGYLEHQGRDGSSPADRVTRAGYRWRSVGENIASGQTTPEQAVQEWIRSPDHCATLMSPDFTEMGLAYAANIDSEGGVYWAQVFGRPR
jgi:uncharacterized protein YkwD